MNMQQPSLSAAILFAALLVFVKGSVSGSVSLSGSLSASLSDSIEIPELPDFDFPIDPEDTALVLAALLNGAQCPCLGEQGTVNLINQCNTQCAFQTSPGPNGATLSSLQCAMSSSVLLGIGDAGNVCIASGNIVVRLSAAQAVLCQNAVNAVQTLSDCVTPAPTSPPTGVTPSPTGVTPSPTGATPAPTDVTASPTGVTPSPTDVTPSPTDVTPSPTDVTPSPTDPTESPTAQPTPMPSDPTVAPTDDTPSPTAVTPSPTDVTPSPTDVTAAPTGAPTPTVSSTITVSVDTDFAAVQAAFPGGAADISAWARRILNEAGDLTDTESTALLTITSVASEMTGTLITATGSGSAVDVQAFIDALMAAIGDTITDPDGTLDTTIIGVTNTALA